ncbi:RNA-binding S4 domain-containing protein [bacterium]|nr:RNA-binding S4 domain-containing protein [bacterium]
MRLDVFLKVSGLIKRRTIANELCDRGLVLVNGTKGKAGRIIKEGDIIDLKIGRYSYKVEILSIPEKKVNRLGEENFRIIEKIEEDIDA